MIVRTAVIRYIAHTWAVLVRNELCQHSDL